MTQTERKFSKLELGQVASSLQQVCRKCPKGSLGCEAATCPIAAARSVIGRYLFSEGALAPGWKAIPVPGDAVVDMERVSESADRVKALCNKCMFHIEHCMLNVLYAHLEVVLGRAGRRPMSQRPAEAN